GNGPCAVLHDAERRLREVTSLCVLRPCMFQESVRNHGGKYFHFFGAHRLPMIATRDVAAHAVRCLLSPRVEVVDLVGPAYGGAEIATALNARLIEVPLEQHTQTLIECGLPAPLASSIAELYACLPHVAPRGDRLVAGATTLPQTVHDARRT
ncbi:MAG TPA: hypothetical protein VFX59_26645, partial [Polyangiales bacterium]|nr:hypothetical protein [Polyangiales bacterium]